MSERDFPQWRAVLDGAPAKLWRVNGSLIGLPIDGGRHDVSLTFEPSEFYLRAAISPSGALVALGLLTVGWYRYRDSTSAIAMPRLVPGVWNRAQQLASRVALLVAGASALVFLALGAWSLKLPGLQYDEVLFVNGALGGITDSFVHWRAFGIPVMLMPYIGALKAYVFAPVFTVFGVSIATIRLPAVLLSALSVLMGYRLGAQATGRRGAGALLALLMATDPIFVFMSRADYGPIVSMVLLKLTALVALFEWLKTEQVRFAYLMTICLGLGLFDKLNFGWIVVAVLAASALCFHRQCVRMASKGTWLFWGAVGVLAASLVTAFGLLARLMQNGQGHLSIGAWDARMAYFIRLYHETLTGQAVDRMMLHAGSMPESPAIQAEMAILGGFLLIAGFWAIRRWHLLQGNRYEPDPAPVLGRRKSLAFFTILYGLIAVQLFFTREATGPHHVMVLWPFNHLLFLLVAIVLVDCVAALPRPLGSIRRTAREKNVDTVMCVDWGICNQVLALVPNLRSRNRDMWPTFADLHEGDRDRRALFEHYFRGRRTLVITRSGDAVVFQHAYDKFTRFAQHYLGNPLPTLVVSDPGGEPVFEVYVIDE